jgi:hypothetical protein
MELHTGYSTSVREYYHLISLSGSLYLLASLNCYVYPLSPLKVSDLM